jgi:hypothetical protein
MADLRALGHEFTVYTLEVPRGRARDVLVQHANLVDVWEVVCSWPDVDRTLAAIREIKTKASLTVCLSKLRTKEDVRREGSRYYHFINHGFVVSERDDLRAWWSTDGVAGAVDGLVFRVVRHASPWVDVAAAHEIASGLGARAAVHVRMASTNPAEEFTDDLANANRVAEALLAAHATGTGGAPTYVFVDTFVDIDRGYFVRNGLIDRRYNPRLPSRVVRHLHAALPTPAVWHGRAMQETGDARVCVLERPGQVLGLVLSAACAGIDSLAGGASLREFRGSGRWIDLDTGAISEVGWERQGAALRLAGTPRCATPGLLDLTD